MELIRLRSKLRSAQDTPEFEAVFDLYERELQKLSDVSGYSLP